MTARPRDDRGVSARAIAWAAVISIPWWIAVGAGLWMILR